MYSFSPGGSRLSLCHWKLKGFKKNWSEMQLLPSHLESIIGKEREICLQHCFLRPCGSAVLWLCGWENQGSPRTESGAGMWALSRSKSAAFLALGEPSFNQGSITVFRIHGGCLCSALISPRALHTFSISFHLRTRGKSWDILTFIPSNHATSSCWPPGHFHLHCRSLSIPGYHSVGWFCCKVSIAGVCSQACLLPTYSPAPYTWPQFLLM